MIALGRIERAVGLRGELRVRLYNPASRTLARDTAVTLRAGAPSTETESRIESVRYTADAAVVALRGVADRDAAEALRGAEVCVARASLPALEDGEHYHVDLVGLGVVDERGAKIGVVTEVLAYPSVDALVVRAGDDAIAELPIVPDVVLRVDVAERVVVVDGESARELMEPPKKPRGAR